MARTLQVVVLAVVAAIWSADASGQIYSWRDASGALVLSDRRPAAGDAPLQTFRVVSAGEPILTTRPGAAARAADYDRLIEENAAANRIRPDLVRAVIQVESGFDPRAVSTKGAMGLMQLMPGTARDLGVGNPFDPAQNIRGGSAYLGQLLERFNQNEELALAAYNAGPESVARYGQRVPPYRETRDYVQKVKGKTELGTGRPRQIIYRILEYVDGQPRYQYTDRKPDSGPYEIVPLR